MMAVLVLLERNVTDQRLLSLAQGLMPLHPLSCVAVCTSFTPDCKQFFFPLPRHFPKIIARLSILP